MRPPTLRGEERSQTVCKHRPLNLEMSLTPSRGKVALAQLQSTTLGLCQSQLEVSRRGNLDWKAWVWPQLGALPQVLKTHCGVL